jgi:uracil-DNA glycosylase
MKSEAEQLQDEVFECERCTGVAEFSRPTNGGPFFKFPPIIGAQGEANLLFIGINPRRTPSNLELHNWLMESLEAFGQLGKNIQKDQLHYIRKCGNEEHYECHMIVVEGVFGSNTAFETKAAVTELLLCASVKAPTVLKEKKSPCAELYLGRVMRIVKPQVVIAVGTSVRQHLEDHFKEEIRVPVVRMDHPRQLHKASWAEKLLKMQPTIHEVRRVLVGNGLNIPS